MKNQNGVSLAEILVVMAILGVMVLGITKMSSSADLAATSPIGRSCEAHAQAVINAVQEETYVREIADFIPLGASGQRVLAQFPSNASTKAVPLASDWWEGLEEPISQVPASGRELEGVRLRSFALLNGSIRSLSAIYNNNSTVQCSYGSYAPLTSDLAMSPTLKNMNAQVRIRISPYEKNSGQSLCSSNYPTQVFLSPEESEPKTALTSAFVAGSGGQAIPASVEEYGKAAGNPVPQAIDAVARIANRDVASPRLPEDPSLGFEMSARVTYVRDGKEEACELSQKFEYPRDTTPPAKPTVAVTSNSTQAPANCAPNPQNRSAEVAIGFPGGAQVEKGIQFLCRDLSWKKVWDPVETSPRFTNAPCYLPSSGRLGVVDPDLRAYAPNPNLQTFSDRSKWVPCDLVPQCGVMPTVRVGAAAPSMILRYANQDFGCVMNMEVVAVDTAGNTSIAGVGSNRTFLEDAVAGIRAGNEIKQNTCGTYCSAAGKPYASDYPKGYYTCRPDGCCADGELGCNPTIIKRSCALSGGVKAADGYSVTLYASCGRSQTRTCRDGVLSGSSSYRYTSCYKTNCHTSSEGSTGGSILSPQEQCDCVCN